VLLLAVWPYLDKSAVTSTGVWFGKERRKQNLIFMIIVLAIMGLTVVGTFMRGPYWHFFWPWQSWPEMPKKF
jgi:hypothetical protein